MSPDKAPGPDGFSDAFYQSAWPVIKVDVIKALDAFFAQNDRHFHYLNGVLLSLLPKRPGAASPKDLYPISLLHNFLKLISKLLANRLAHHLGNIILFNQSASIKRRSIQDNSCSFSDL